MAWVTAEWHGCHFADSLPAGCQSMAANPLHVEAQSMMNGCQSVGNQDHPPSATTLSSDPHPKL